MDKKKIIKNTYIDVFIISINIQDIDIIHKLHYNFYYSVISYNKIALILSSDYKNEIFKHDIK